MGGFDVRVQGIEGGMAWGYHMIPIRSFTILWLLSGAVALSKRSFLLGDT